MKNLINILFSTLLLLVFAVGCDSEDELLDDRKAEIPEPGGVELTGDNGGADFSNYVAIGNSVTAGYMDFALYTDAQNNSFPNILASQLQISGIGGGTFNQPDINSANGFNPFFSDLGAGQIAGRTFLDLSIPGPSPTVGELPGPYTGDKSALNNFGVQGIILAQALTPFTGGPDDPANPAYNPYYARFASAPGTSTILGDAIATGPTFFTFWLGGNDVLGYATSGGNGSIPLTDTGDFQDQYTQALSNLAATGAKGVVITVPPVLTLPFFNAVGYNPVPLAEAQATALNGAFGGFNAALDGIVTALGHDADDAARRKISYSAGEGNKLLIVDEDLENLGPKFDILVGAGAISPAERAALEPFVQARPAEPTDIVPLTTGAVIGQDLNPAAPGTALLGISVPMGDEYILTPAEQVEIVTARATYNGIIAGVVQGVNASIGANNIAIYDIQPLIADIAGLSTAAATQLALSPAGIAAADGVAGYEIQGFNLAPDFSPNGIYSTDGIHPNPKGSALIANEVVQVINDSFGADIPDVDIAPYRTVLIQ